MKLFAEVHGVSAKSNADDIRVDGKNNQIFIRVDTAKEHIKWIATLQSAVTKSMYYSVQILQPSFISNIYYCNMQEAILLCMCDTFQYDL